MWYNKKLFKIIFLLFLLLNLGIFTTKNLSLSPKKVVNVYDWYGMLPTFILEQFKKETGIDVVYDMYTNNEVLEAKLLASNSGYDVVFPTASPYAARQIKIGAYQPLNKNLLPNLKNINPFIAKEMRKVDPEASYVVPFYWGTLGIIYDVDKIKRLLPHGNHESHSLLLDPENLKILAPFGVSFLEEPVDVFPLILRFLGKNPNSVKQEDLKEATNHLLKLRPYILRFTSSRFVNDLVMGDTCIAQGWSGDSHLAIDEAKELGRNIKFFTPQEGSTLWVDCAAIPIGAPHPENAHIFINFLARPDIAARLTNQTKLPTVFLDSIPLIKEEIRNDKSIFFTETMMSKLILDKPRLSHHDLSYERLRTRMWTRVRISGKA